MKIKRVAKHTTAATLAAALLVGGGYQTFARGNDSKDFNNSYGISHITRDNMVKIPQQQNSDQFKVPLLMNQLLKTLLLLKGR